MDELPNEILFLVFTKLGPRSLISIAITSRRFRDIITDDRLWRLLLSDFVGERSFFLSSLLEHSYGSYKELYVQLSVTRKAFWTRKSVLQRSLTVSSGTCRVPLRCLVLGERNCGKSSLCDALTQTYGDCYNPTLEVGVYKQHLMLERKHVMMTVCDTPGESLWFLSEQRWLDILAEVDACIVCFDLMNPKTLSLAATFWLPLVHAIDPKFPIVVCACKSDLHEVYTNLHDEEEEGQTFAADGVVTFRQIQDLEDSTHLEVEFMSARDVDIDEPFMQAARAALCV